MKAGASTRWFAYIAVGITLVSMLVGMALLIGAIIFLYHHFG
ncbi:MAG TPA: hypothetical protein VFE47_31945 [Tepidisphaeraceae bacterium]|jgi:hypothetical protein|nr:hypothetical protein [Tepidisphaeraceae bacterium]